MQCVGNTDLIFFSITEEDVPEDKLGIFNVLKEPTQKILVVN